MQIDDARVYPCSKVGRLRPLCGRRLKAATGDGMVLLVQLNAEEVPPQLTDSDER
jgi:hypothetical protein